MVDVFLPESASAHGEDYDKLMLISMVLIMFVQIITQGLLHFFHLSTEEIKTTRHCSMQIMTS